MLGELRHALSAVFFGNPLFSPQEQLLANHHIHECENAEQLARWLSNAPVALAKRQRANSSLTVSSIGHVV
ncbi:MAG: hypothetical protein M3Y54_21620 [Bacteroidota bacterium]|nr:hypothetical protein [Bacteroidota bacterium]